MSNTDTFSDSKTKILTFVCCIARSNRFSLIPKGMQGLPVAGLLVQKEYSMNIQFDPQYVSNYNSHILSETLDDQLLQVIFHVVALVRVLVI